MRICVSPCIQLKTYPTAFSGFVFLLILLFFLSRDDFIQNNLEHISFLFLSFLATFFLLPRKSILTKNLFFKKALNLGIQGSEAC